MSVTSRCSVETDGRNNLVFGMELLSTSPTLCFKEIQVSTKLRVPPSGTFFLISGLTKFRRRTCHQLSWRKVVAPDVIDWIVVGKLS